MKKKAIAKTGFKKFLSVFLRYIFLEMIAILPSCSILTSCITDSGQKLFYGLDKIQILFLFIVFFSFIMLAFPKSRIAIFIPVLGCIINIICMPLLILVIIAFFETWIMVVISPFFALYFLLAPIWIYAFSQRFDKIVSTENQTTDMP